MINSLVPDSATGVDRVEKYSTLAYRFPYQDRLLCMADDVSLRARRDLGIKMVKGYSNFPQTAAHHWLQFIVMPNYDRIFFRCGVVTIDVITKYRKLCCFTACSFRDAARSKNRTIRFLQVRPGGFNF